MLAAFYTGQGAAADDAVGTGVPRERIGERVWTWNAQWNRACGTGAQFVAIAKHQGATVLTTVSTEAKAEHPRAAGADHVIRYRDEDVGARVHALTDGRGVDAVIEMDRWRPAAQHRPAHAAGGHRHGA